MKSEEAGRHQSNEDMSEDVSRVEEQGEADEPDAPTSGEENAGMSTILDADPLSGVQTDASEE
ncbi:MAG TPA: hypothetical protein VGO69_00525 [Pyrinomonadaceae bacterium]|nr:hypothetical protein [Pyrinomonadaceae bacterium]